PQALFKALFGAGVPPGDAGTAPPPRPLIVDRVLADYQALRNGNARLSSDDRRRLDDHMARLHELQVSLVAQQQQSTSAACANPNTSSGDMYRDFNAIVAMALICGYTRVASFGISTDDLYNKLPPGHPSDGGDFHENVAHRWMDPTNQSGILLPIWRKYF